MVLWIGDFFKEGILETVSLGRERDGGWPDLKALQCPTLILRGSESTEISDDEMGDILKANSKPSRANYR